jgi:hypothetical protein
VPKIQKLVAESRDDLEKNSLLTQNQTTNQKYKIEKNELNQGKCVINTANVK